VWTGRARKDVGAGGGDGLVSGHDAAKDQGGGRGALEVDPAGEARRYDRAHHQGRRRWTSARASISDGR